MENNARKVAGSMLLPVQSVAPLNQSDVKRGKKETHMPIRLVVANCENSYLATDAGILIDAFEAALNELGLLDRNHPAALVVANRIIAFAKIGVLDPVQLRDLTVKAVRKKPRPPLTDSPVAIPSFQ